MPPNELADRGPLERVEARVRAHAEELRRSRDQFEALLAGRTYMWGDAFSVIDCAFFPFLKYAAIDDPEDTEPFHRILAEHLWLNGRYPRLRRWIDRVDGHPRA